MLRSIVTSVLCVTLTIFSSVLIAEKKVTAKPVKKIATSAAELSQLVSELRTYQADFEQTVSDENGQPIDFSAGTFSIQRPNNFRWEIKQDFQQLIVADGYHLYIYDQDLEQVTIQNQSNLLADSPLLLLTSNADELSQSFEVESIAVVDKSERRLFHLKPRKEDSVFDSVHILFEQGKILELMMADSLGQQTTVKFSQIQMNPKLDMALFSFKIPEGVDVVDSREEVPAQ